MRESEPTETDSESNFHPHSDLRPAHETRAPPLNHAPSARGTQLKKTAYSSIYLLKLEHFKPYFSGSTMVFEVPSCP